MNEDLPKDWDNAKVRREIVASSADISTTLEYINRFLRSPFLDMAVVWLQWLNRAAETYDSHIT